MLFMATAFKKGLPMLTEKDVGHNTNPRPVSLVCASAHPQASLESRVSCLWHLSTPHLLHGHASSWFQEQAINKLFLGSPCPERFSCSQSPPSTLVWNSLLHSTTRTSVFPPYSWAILPVLASSRFSSSPRSCFCAPQCKPRSCIRGSFS